MEMATILTVVFTKITEADIMEIEDRTNKGKHLST